MKTIPLTQGKESIIDDCHYTKVCQYNWQARNENGKWYAYRASPNRETANQPLHHLIADLVGWSYTEIDHRNGNGLDNRRENLRPATRNQQLQNARLRSDNKSKFKGVSYRSDCGLYRAVINNPETKRQESLGYYATAEQAAYIYDHFARLYFGEFACVNFPKEGERSAI
jgi:hypothetical protein